MKKEQINCFINTREEWEYIESKFPNYEKVILTNSPEVIFNKSNNMKIIQIDKEISKKMVKFSREIGNISNKVFDKIKKLNYSHSLCCHFSLFILNFSQIIRAALPLKKEFFFQSNLIIDIKTKDNNVYDSLKNPYLKIFKGSKKLIVKEIYLKDKKFFSKLVSPPFFLRNSVLGLINIEFNLWRIFWRLFPKYLSNGIFLVGVDGYFVRETLINLSRKGYSFKQLQRPDINLSRIDKKKYEKFIKVILPFKTFLFKWLDQYIAKKIYKIFLNDLSIFLTNFEHNEKYWNKILSKFPKKSIKGLISTHLLLKPFHAIGDSFINKKIPIFNFQHGHTRELNNRSCIYYKWDSIVEPIGDKIFTYTKLCQDLSNKTKCIRGNFEAVGTPKIYQRRKHLFYKSKYDVIYVSTNFFTGMKVNTQHRDWDDCKKMNFEIDLIKKIFEKINKKILYKNYPLAGNLSDCILKDKISSVNNIKLIKKNYDLIYFLRKRRIIITSGASGTLGYCVLSNMPLIYIDHKNYTPLRTDLIPLFKKSFFYFNASDKFFFLKLREFLNMPIKRIYDLWNQKKKSRDKSIKNFFSINTKTAGKEACNKILNYKY